MDKLLYFRTTATLGDDDDAAQSLCVPTSAFLAGQPTGDTALTLYFNEHTDTTAGINKTTVVLTVGDNKHKEVLKSFCEFVRHSTEDFLVVGDDVTSEYFDGNVTALGAITVVAAA